MTDVATRFAKWITGRDTGLSSKAIAAHMIGVTSEGDYPGDPDDLGRCLRLLKIIPEWNSRIPEMKKYGLGWLGLADAWPEISASMIAEVGIDWSKGRRAEKTYELMRQLIDQGIKADARYEVTVRADGSISSYCRRAA